MKISEVEWSESLGRKVFRFHRRPVSHGICFDCGSRVLIEELGLSHAEVETLIAD